ncbi:MAG: hypothetical protein ACREVY_15230 [Gammaproteobacteria bacterium]
MATLIRSHIYENEYLGNYARAVQLVLGFKWMMTMKPVWTRGYRYVFIPARAGIQGVFLITIGCEFSLA